MYSWFFAHDETFLGGTDFEKAWQNVVLWVDAGELYAYGVSLSNNGIRKGRNFNWDKIKFPSPIALADIDTTVWIRSSKNILDSFTDARGPPSAAQKAAAIKPVPVVWEEMTEAQQGALSEPGREDLYASQMIPFGGSDDAFLEVLQAAFIEDL